MPVKDRKGPVDIVVGKNNDIIKYALRGSFGQGNAVRAVNAPPLVGACKLAYLGKVVSSMVSPLCLGNFWLPGKRPGCFDHCHHCFGSGVYETDLFEPRGPFIQVLCKLVLHLRSERIGGATLHLGNNRLNNCGMAMTMDQRGHVVGKIKPFRAIDICNIAAFCLCCIMWMWLVKNSVPANPARNDLNRLSIYFPA